MQVNDIRNFTQKIRENIKKVIVGKDEVIDLIVLALICSGHVLLEDVPGLGKTVLAKAFSKSIDSSFSRIQFTPDLLPSDLTGINFYNQKIGEFQFRKGPIMNQIVLADEINRATPRTQSSLLESMEEHQVTVDGVTNILDEPFMVIATQNPVEIKGTFPLPEAQLDRFFMKVSLGYPELKDEMEILKRFKSNNPMSDLAAVTNCEDIIEARKIFNNIIVSDEIIEYLLKIVEKTRNHEKLELGVSPRGSLALFKAVQGYAAMNGRDYVLPDDVKSLVRPVFRHRVILNGHAEITGESTDDILTEILNSIPTPVEIELIG